MNDIVERLRARAKSLRGMGSIAHVDADTDDEAADEITHLRKKVEWHTHAVHTCHAECDRPLCQTTRERDTLRAENERLRAALDGAYNERNRLVAFIARLLPSGLKKTAIEGWDETWHGCVYIDLPTGQASWHYHDREAHLFDGLPPYSGEWDGHSTDEKYERIARAALAAQPAPGGKDE